MSETVKMPMARLIERAESACEPDRDLDAEIWLTIEPSLCEGGYEKEAPGWLIRRKPSVAYRKVPRFSGSLDDARTVSNWVLIHASDVGADGLPLVILGNPETGAEVKGIAFGGHKAGLPCAMLVAALRAKEADNAGTR